MRDLEALADRVEIAALPGGCTDAVMIQDYEVRYLDTTPLAGSPLTRSP